MSPLSPWLDELLACEDNLLPDELVDRILARGDAARAALLDVATGPQHRGYGSTHFALSVATDAQTVEEIASRAGWDCFVCNRGPFHVIEVWVENATMVEILPPEFAREYLAFTRPDKVTAAMAAAPVAAGRQP